MAFSSEESFNTRDVQSDSENYSIEITYVISGDPGDVVNEQNVRDFILKEGGVAGVVDGLPINAIRSINRVNSLQYKALVRYQNVGELEADEEIPQGPTIAFDTTGGSEHISYGIKLVSSAGNPSAEIGAAINFDGQRINGIDVQRPALRFTQTFELPDSQVTTAYKILLSEFTGSVNDTALGAIGAIAGRRGLLFLGAVGSKTITLDDIEDLWTITFNFAVRQTERNIIFNEGLTDEFVIIEVFGWDYLWVQYENVDDSKQNRIVQKPIAAYVDQVFPEKDFTQLGVEIAL